MQSGAFRQVDRFLTRQNRLAPRRDLPLRNKSRLRSVPTRNCQQIDQTFPSDRASRQIVDLARGVAIYRLRSRRVLASARRDIFRPANRAASCRRRDWWKFSWRCVRCPQRIRGFSAGDSGLYSHRHDENFVVRAGRFDFVDVARVRDLLAVRRNRIHVLTAEIKRRHIVIARREISCCSGGRAGRSPISRARHGRLYTLHKQMAALEFGERAPMPIEQSRKDFRFHFALLQLFVALLVARVIFAIRINRRHKHDVLTVG